MKTKIPIQYIDFSMENLENASAWFRKKEWEIRKDCCGDFSGLKIIRNKDIIKTIGNRELAILKRKLKDYDYSDAVVFGDYKMSGLLHISDISFEARKNEFLNNRDYIIETIGAKSCENATVVIDNSSWNRKEVFSILITLKDHYRRIKILADTERVDLSDLAEVFYDEWGAVISIYPLNCYPPDKQNFVLFLLKRWNLMWEYRIRYDAAYVVETEIRDHKRTRGKGRNTFSGLVYNNKKPVSYELGVNMAWQKPVMYEKFHVNVIDIYELE